MISKLLFEPVFAKVMTSGQIVDNYYSLAMPLF